MRNKRRGKNEYNQHIIFGHLICSLSSRKPILYIIGLFTCNLRVYVVILRKDVGIVSYSYFLGLIFYEKKFE